jgi:poly(3-hydroxybutyrate) depolymerase
LPAGHESQALPLLVFFHGTGGKGSLAILRLQALAERERFIVLAPDSASVAGVWIVGQRPGETTQDSRHVMACLREVLAAPGAHIDVAHVLAAGFSVGANGAYLATHEAVLTSSTAALRQVELRVFRADHTLQDEELSGLIAWWLGARAVH